MCRHGAVSPLQISIDPRVIATGTVAPRKPAVRWLPMRGGLRVSSHRPVNRSSRAIVSGRAPSDVRSINKKNETVVRTYPGGVGEGTQRCPISQARRLRASSVAGTGPRRASSLPQATRKKDGKRCANMRTIPSFHTCSRSKEMISYSRLLSVASPHTAPMAGTNARALCSVRR